jgi:hypothetical protein
LEDAADADDADDDEDEAAGEGGVTAANKDVEDGKDADCDALTPFQNEGNAARNVT